MVLDKILPNSAVAIIGLPLGGKEQLVLGFVQLKLKAKEPILMLSTDKSPEDIKKEFLKSKVFIGSSETDGMLAFIDCYSAQVGESAKSTPSIKSVPGPLALNEISIALSEIEKEFLKKNQRHNIIFNSVSTLLMYSNPQAIGRFLQVIIAKAKKAGGTILLTLEEGMHAPDVLVSMEHLVDEIIFVKSKDGKLFVKARGVKGFEDWKEFT
ncbi:MAG TPA: ATPase domain-containing protein [Candidatus Nanoarchaeia archaeon]|nr:ATPase domain-containing protein [Candidatus Nanoarchaeia archaeon]